MNANAFIKVDKATFFRFVATEPEGRFEYVRGRIMQQQQGGTKRHGQIAGRFAEACRRQLEASGWIVLEGRGVETSQTIRYADVVVEPADEPAESLAATRPSLIIEILSPSSSDRDLDVKPAEYLSLSTLQAYIVAGQDEAACYAWRRDATGRFPSEPDMFRGEGQIVEIPALSLSISLADIYRGLLSPPRPENPTAN